MQFFQTWKESLTMLKGENLKQFLLMTLNSLAKTYKVLFSQFWFIVIAALIMDMWAYYLLTHVVHDSTAQSTWSTIIVWLSVFLGATGMLMLLCMAIFLCARSSVQNKTREYALHYWRHFISFFFIWFFALICKNISLTLFIYWIFFVFFLLDSDGGLRSVLTSFKRSLYMFFYNGPFMLISICFFWILFLPIAFLGQSFEMISFAVKFCLIHIIQLPLLICFYNTLYDKKKYEQFTLYFSEKGSK